MSDLKERLRGVERGDYASHRVIGPSGEPARRVIPYGNMMHEAADRLAALEDALVEEREENLWHAYHSGHAKDGQWTHMFMSDGEWLAKECGFNPRAGHYDDAAIKAAIPEAAKRVLKGDA